MSKAFEGLRERLLRGGIGPRRAGRYVAELTDHLDDLIAEARAAGSTPEAARAQAIARMGSPDDLAQAMIARRELRSWTARAPFLAFVLTPTFIMALTIGGWLIGVVAACNWLREKTNDRLDFAYWLSPWTDGLAWSSNMILPLLLGWTLAFAAARQRAAPLWPVLGLVLLAAIGAALQVDVTLPRPGVQGEIELVAAMNAPAFGLANHWGRLAFNLLLTILPYGAARVWPMGAEPASRSQ